MYRRPETYDDWRSLYQSYSMSLGFKISTSWNCKHLPLPNRCNGYCFVIDRHLWKLIHRIERIRKRLDVEHEAFTTGFANALLKAINKHG